MAKEWARFGSGQFIQQQATSPQQHISGHPNGIQLPPPPLPHLPLSPYNPLLQYADRDRQHSPSFLLHPCKPMPLACSPSPNPSPNHLLADRLQSPSSPFFRHNANQFVTPSSPSSPKFGGGTNDGRRLSAPTPPLGLPYHMSPGGRSSASPGGLPPSPLWRSTSNPEGEKGRSVVSSADVQDRLRYLAQQRSWQKDQGRQPEASLRMGFGTTPPQPSPERSPSSLSTVNGPFGGLGGLAVPSMPNSLSCDQTTTNKSVGVLGHKGENCSVIPGSRNDALYGSRQMLPTTNPADQSLCAVQRQATPHLSVHKDQPANAHSTGRTTFINGYDSNRMESSRMKMSKPSSVSVMIPSRPPPAYPQNGVAFAKSSAPTLQTRKPSSQESQRKNPDMLSREREQEILADIRKRFSLPTDQWASKLEDNHKVMSNKTEPQQVKQESLDKVKKRKKTEASIPTKTEQDKDENFMKAQTKLDPMLEKYPIYSKIMASFIEASNKSGLNSAYSCLKKNNERMEKHDGVVSEIKKKKKKKLKLLKEAGKEVPAGSNPSLQNSLVINKPCTDPMEKTCAENTLPSIAGFAFLQKDSSEPKGSLQHSYSNIPTPASETSNDVGYNVHTYNSVLSKLQDQLKGISEQSGTTISSEQHVGEWMKSGQTNAQSVQEAGQGVDSNNGAALSSHKAPFTPDSLNSFSHQLSAGTSSNNSDSRDCGRVDNNTSANHPTQSPVPAKGQSSYGYHDRLVFDHEHQGTPLDKSAMCCDTCHKVGKQDSYLCSAHKVLSEGCDKAAVPSSVSGESAVRVKLEHNGGFCDSNHINPQESSGTEGRELCNQTGFLTDDPFSIKTSAACEVKDVEFKCEEQDRLDRLKSNAKIEIPTCNCLGTDYQYNEASEGPFYTHLGAASSMVAIRHIMEERFNFRGSAIRIEKVKYTGKEGKSSQGCPIAKWILRRSGPDEKVMCIVKHRAGHFCPTAYIIVAIVAWEGLPAHMADEMYNYVVSTVTSNGFETDRRCGTNEAKTCACQGWDLQQRGASFSFGCSWSMYFNGCKFARSREARKFKLKDTSKEEELERHFQQLATHVGPLYKQSAPESYNNQVAFEEQGYECRLGNEPGRPFSGVTTCMDFCAHAHKDLHNMNNGCTVVVTLTKHRGFDKPEDEQLHVLPLYVLDSTDEYGSEEGLYEKVRTGSLEVLHNYPMEARIRAYPLTPKKRGKGKKDSPSKKDLQKAENNAQYPSQSPKDTDASLCEKQLQYQTMQELQFQRHQRLQKKMRERNAMHSAFKNNSGIPGSQMLPNPVTSNEMPQSGTGVHQQGHHLYQAFCSYFEKFGTFPPQPVPLSNPETSPHLSQYEQQQQQQQQPPSQQQEQQQQALQQIGALMDSQSQGIAAATPGQVSQSAHAPYHNNTYPGHNTSTSSQPSGVDSNHRVNGMLPPEGMLPPAGMLLPGQDRTAPFLSNPQQSPKDCFQSEPGLGQGPDGPSPSKRPHVASSHYMNHPNMSSESPLHLLSEAVSIRSKAMDGPMTNTTSSTDQHWAWPGVKQECPAAPQNGMPAPEGAKPRHSHPTQPLRHEVNFNFGGDSRPDCVDGCMRDTNFLSAEMEYNEDSFLDPNIGGVAVALTHGSVYFEVAKRELHATTALRRPNRKNPTRISMVFYQHKNMNLRHHGWYENERKAEMMRVKRLERMKEGGTVETPSKPGPKKKKKKPEEVNFASTSAAKYKYMWEAPVNQANTMTTDSIIVRWIDSQPMVTGPYQRWVSH